MSAVGAIGSGRMLAESLMDSECVIERQVGVVRDPDTLIETPQMDTIYSGPCSFKYPNARPNDMDVVSQQVTSQRPVLSIPVAAAGSAAVLVNDVVTITANPLDPALVGLRGRIAGGHALTHGTARRLPVEVLS